MTEIAPTLVQYLRDEATVSELVGGRIDHKSNPAGTELPKVRVMLISSPNRYTMAAPMALRRSRVQVDVDAVLPALCDAIANVILERLDGYRGTIGDWSILGIFLGDRREPIELPKSGSGEPTHRTSLDLIVNHKPI